MPISLVGTEAHVHLLLLRDASQADLFSRAAHLALGLDSPGRRDRRPEMGSSQHPPHLARYSHYPVITLAMSDYPPLPLVLAESSPLSSFYFY